MLPTRFPQKLLVLNVFFAPVVGGATQVAQDQVQALAEHWAISGRSRCSAQDEPGSCQLPQIRTPGCSQDHSLQIHGWNGVRVVRLALPVRPWREHHDPRVEQLCRWWFAQEGFDLVHAHAIQVLGVGPLRVAAELGIPYAVTLHDGWWLSPRQFLLTPLGRPVDLNDPIGHHDVPDRISPEQLERERRRRQELEQLLQGAAARIAVSDSLRNCIAGRHRSGHGDGEPLAADALCRPPAAAPLINRCAAAVWEACVCTRAITLQAALLQAQPAAPGLELTVLDGSLNDDQGYSLTWGLTPCGAARPADARDGGLLLASTMC